MMRADTIAAVGIDEGGSPWDKPAAVTFPYIYREAMEVHWSAERLRLYNPRSREWPPLRWFKQIRDAAREQGLQLEVGQTTSWAGIDPELRQAMTGDELLRIAKADPALGMSRYDLTDFK